MRKIPALVSATLLAFLAPLFALQRQAYAATGIHVHNGRLVEANGHDLILRGINHAYAWFPAQTSSFAAMKAVGANSVRLSLSIGERWKPANTVTEVSGVIALCKRNRLICIFDAHDTMGLGQQAGAATISQAVDYWISIRAALVGQENYVILNIADEPFGYHITSTWTQDTMRAIGRLRAAGFRHTFMVDAPDWGQDGLFTMRDNARTVLAADPSGNTVFDIHMYGVFNTPAKVHSYLASFTGRRLPIVIGEFSSDHPYGKPAYDAIMAYAQAYRVGYIGWSWSGNTEAAYLDMVRRFNPADRTPWGARFIAGANGLRQTAREATIYTVARKHTRKKTRLWTLTAPDLNGSHAGRSWPIPAGGPGGFPGGAPLRAESAAAGPLEFRSFAGSGCLSGWRLSGVSVGCSDRRRG
jgi:mannan endo-1,4-beta-mannosidase